jgi:hypothetical protein
MFDDSKEAIRTARSILRSKLLKLATQVDDNKHPQVEITEGLKELSILNADWVRADMEQVFETAIIKTNPEVEKQKKFLEETQGVPTDEDVVVGGN